MASSFSSDLKLELMVTGENAGTWGDNTNNNLNLIQQAIAGFEQVTLSSGGTLALAMTDKTISNARNMVIKFASATIAASTICTIPDSIEKFYIFDATGLTNPSNLTIKTASGTGFTLDAAKIYAAYSDGTNLNEVSLDTLGGTIGSAQIADNAVVTAKISDNQVTTAKISDAQITSAKISDNQIVTAKVSDLQITTAKIADDAITPDKLSNTAVTAGTYAVATITVDAQGRITSASAGSAGGGGYAPVRQTFSGNGNHTTTGNTSKMMVFLQGAGGGGGGYSNWDNRSGGEGGHGGYGISVHDADPSTSYAYALGNGGSGGNPATPGNNGGSGNASNFGSPSTFITANGGGGGEGGSHPNEGGGRAGTPGSTGNISVNSGTLTISNYTPSTYYGIDSDTGGAPDNTGSSGRLYVWEDI